MALFGVGVMVGPVLGPVLGGWLTENYSWRYVFYINLPIGILGLIGMIVFLPDTPRREGDKLDWFGFGTLSLTIGALQVMLDRGEIKDWFGSGEIIIEAVVAASAFYLFIVHTFTARKAVRAASICSATAISPPASIFVSIVGLTYYSSLALQPPYLQELMNYPVVTAGLVMGPRGVGTMASMLVVGRLVGRVDTRILLGIGLALTAWSFYRMTGWTPDVSQSTIISVGVVQGVGLGFLFVPLSAATLSTLSAEQRTEGAGFYNLSRNIGSSVGISVVNALLTRNTQVNHASIAARHGRESRLRQSFDRAFLGSADGGRPRGTRFGRYRAGADHRLYRRLQAADDRNARGVSAAPGVPALGSRPIPAMVAD